MANLVLNCAKSFKVASRQKSTNLHICPFLSGVIDGTLDLEKFTFGEEWTFCFESILHSLKSLGNSLADSIHALVVFNTASYHAVGHFRYINKKEGKKRKI